MKTVGQIKTLIENSNTKEWSEIFTNPLEFALALFLTGKTQEAQERFKEFFLEDLIPLLEEETSFILDFKVDWSSLEALKTVAILSNQYEKSFIVKQVAEHYAKIMHDSIGHKRKYSGEPYWVHLQEVSHLVASVGGSHSMQSAAFLHDVVEDVKVPPEEIERIFGKEISALVEMLTDVSQPSDGNRKLRKEKDLAHTASASPDAKTIKLADLISNSISIIKDDPNFAKVYMREKQSLMQVLKEGHPQLYLQAQEIMNNYYKVKS